MDSQASKSPVLSRLNEREGGKVPYAGLSLQTAFTASKRIFLMQDAILVGPITQGESSFFYGGKTALCALRGIEMG